MAGRYTVVISPRAEAALQQMIEQYPLIGDTRDRLRERLEVLERFPFIGRNLPPGEWGGHQLLLGPFAWMASVCRVEGDVRSRRDHRGLPGCQRRERRLAGGRALRARAPSSRACYSRSGRDDLDIQRVGKVKPVRAPRRGCVRRGPGSCGLPESGPGGFVSYQSHPEPRRAPPRPAPSDASARRPRAARAASQTSTAGPNRAAQTIEDPRCRPTAGQRARGPQEALGIRP